MRWLNAPQLIEAPDASVMDAVNLAIAAKWAGVAPWELAEKPIFWLDSIRTAMEVEAASAKRAAKTPAGGE